MKHPLVIATLLGATVAYIGWAIYMVGDPPRLQVAPFRVREQWNR
jgi:hypothetical protein